MTEQQQNQGCGTFTCANGESFPVTYAYFSDTLDNQHVGKITLTNGRSFPVITAEFKNEEGHQKLLIVAEKREMMYDISTIDSYPVICASFMNDQCLDWPVCPFSHKRPVSVPSEDTPAASTSTIESTIKLPHLNWLPPTISMYPPMASFISARRKNSRYAKENLEEFESQIVRQARIEKEYPEHAHYLEIPEERERKRPGIKEYISDDRNPTVRIFTHCDLDIQKMRTLFRELGLPVTVRALKNDHFWTTKSIFVVRSKSRIENPTFYWQVLLNMKRSCGDLVSQDPRLCDFTIIPGEPPKSEEEVARSNEWCRKFEEEHKDVFEQYHKKMLEQKEKEGSQPRSFVFGRLSRNTLEKEK